MDVLKYPCAEFDFNAVQIFPLIMKFLAFRKYSEKKTIEFQLKK